MHEMNGGIDTMDDGGSIKTEADDHLNSGFR